MRFLRLMQWVEFAIFDRTGEFVHEPGFVGVLNYQWQSRADHREFADLLGKDMKNVANE